MLELIVLGAVALFVGIVLRAASAPMVDLEEPEKPKLDKR